MTLIMPRRSLRRPPTLTYVRTNTDETDRSTYTFTDEPIGSAQAGTDLLIIVGWRNSSGTLTLSGATVDGETATEVDPSSSIEATERGVLLLRAPAPNDTSATLQFSLSGTANRLNFSAWRISRYAKLVAATGATTIGTTLNFSSTATKNRGVSVWAVFDSSGTSAFSWGTATEREDFIPVTGRWTAADHADTGANIAPSAANANGGTLKTGVGATFR